MDVNAALFESGAVKAVKSEVVGSCPLPTRRADNNERVLDILHELTGASKQAGWGVRGLAEHLGESRSTVNRILMDLTDEGLAVQTTSGAYTTGPRLIVLARRLVNNPLTAAAHPLLRELAARCEGTAVLALYDPPRARGVVVSVTDAPGPVRYRLVAGTTIPLHAGAAGRAILTEVGVDALGDEQLDALTADTVTDRDRLVELIDVDRKLGYSISVGQRFDLAAGVAASFRCRGLIGAVSITRPRDDVTDDDLNDAAERVRGAARQLALVPIDESLQPVLGARHDPPDTPATPRSLPTRNTTVGRFAKLLAGLVGPDCLEHSRKEVAALIGTSPATAGKLIDVMVATGVATVWGKRICPGPRLFHWFAMIGTNSGITDVVDHIVTKLAGETGETVGVAEYLPTEGCAQFVAIRLGSSQLQYQLTLGERIPLHAGAAGKAVLAYLPQGSVDDSSWERYTEQTLSTAVEIEPVLVEVRARGWATGLGERVSDAFGVAAPYFVDGQVGGSLTVTVPRHRSADIDVAELGERVVAAAAAVTALLSIRA